MHCLECPVCMLTVACLLHEACQGPSPGPASWRQAGVHFSSLPLTAPLCGRPRSKLSVYLPHNVDSDKGKAKFCAKSQVLSVTLPIVREDPF
eukprot:353284-Chlamydomonas_euryale.AAC.7